jgi:hypothetical protein
MKAAALAVLISSVLLAACQPMVGRGTFGAFQRSLNTTAYGYSVVPDPTGTAPTPMVERFEVRPGDCGREPGWSDCDQDRERSELSEQFKSTGAGATWWYGWSLFVPEDYVNVYPTKVALGQFHQEKSHVIWMFQNDRGGYHLDDQALGSTRQYYELIPQNDLQGKWHRIEVQTKWSRGGDGFFRVWTDGVRKVNYAGPTMTADKVYFKYGLYRSFLTRYRAAKHVDAVPAQTIYFTNVRRSATREGLAAPLPSPAK